MTIYLPLLVCLIGLAIYLLTDKAKALEIGRWMFIIGLFAFLCCGGDRVVAVLHK